MAVLKLDCPFSTLFDLLLGDVAYCLRLLLHSSTVSCQDQVTLSLLFRLFSFKVFFVPLSESRCFLIKPLHVLIDANDIYSITNLFYFVLFFSVALFH